MTSIDDIQKEICRVFKAVFKSAKVYREPIKTLISPAFHIKLLYYSNNVLSYDVVEKHLELDITYFNESNSQSEALDINEKLMSIFLPCFKIGERYITPRYEPETKYVDQDLHYLITFDYFDEYKKIDVDSNGTITTTNPDGSKDIEHNGNIIHKDPDLMKEIFIELEN